MNIFVLRHAIAVEREEWNGDEVERPLTPEGEAQQRKVCAAMKRLALKFDVILSSPYERAKRTAEIVAEELSLKKQLTFSDELRPEGNPKKLIREIMAMDGVPENLLLVGHEPYLSEWIAVLLTGKAKMEIDFKKSGLCRLKVDNLDYDRCATLVWLMGPKQMELMV
jgi:phosphohistidine phosphatase